MRWTKFSGSNARLKTEELINANRIRYMPERIVPVSLANPGLDVSNAIRTSLQPGRLPGFVSEVRGRISQIQIKRHAGFNDA